VRARVALLFDGKDGDLGADARGDAPRGGEHRARPGGEEGVGQGNAARAAAYFGKNAASAIAGPSGRGARSTMSGGSPHSSIGQLLFTERLPPQLQRPVEIIRALRRGLPPDRRLAVEPDR
jgi:hypothetical protein